MPSNNEFKKEITKLAKELDLVIVTDGLSNNKLAALIKDLRAKKKDAETETQADTAVSASAAAESDSSRKKDGYYLCKGKAITTRRGILSNGDEIKAEDISGGKEALDHFVETKHLEKE